ncbi:putative transcriptional acitvator, Baf family [Thermodesulfatator indicus DSM 15286]|uniref:Type III pantothenate kinase n=1 Tax=Thermodesulfatator indicus (strain DSM 15286 / JCM 11887 / CIR29812) TaxID=667014 RepID=F8ABE3_THEID|nr:type III pantothenate kinase [Thermodesulfatator indicus]AEH44453.1 putative transcriptional acitvator, Baf family [Thermodesulfatator indicus DSM 15286]
MILAVDIGNTNTTCGFFAEDELLFRFRLFSSLNQTADELALRLNGLLELRGKSLADIKHLLIGSVVPPLTKTWLEMASIYGIEDVKVATPEKIGIPVKLRYPCEVGVDRVLNALAGWHKYRQSLIIVDYGTATTFDCISEKGEYLGGAIAPGVMAAAETLFKKTSKLPRLEFSKVPEEIIGKDTISAMRTGVLWGFAALTDGLITRLAGEFEKKPYVIATGGLAKLMARLSLQIKEVEPDLTLEGLVIWFKKKNE